MSYWHDDPSAPDLSIFGSNWVLVQAPVSDEELLREYCEITHTPPGAAADLIDCGDVSYPFDGSAFLKTNLATGAHVFTAAAQYDGEGDTISRPQSHPVSFTATEDLGQETAAQSSTKVKDLTDLDDAPQILAQSCPGASGKWVLLQTPEFPDKVQVGRRTYTFQRCIIKRLWKTAGKQKRIVAAILTTPNIQPVLDNKNKPLLANGAVYKAIGIYFNKNAPAGQKQHRVKSADSQPVQF